MCYEAPVTLTTNFTDRTVADFLELWRNGRLNLEPAFQRKSVWSTKDRQLLIESIFRGIPVPSVFLYKQTGKNGKPIYDVIDGKQRLESLLLYMGKGPLAAEQELWVRTSINDETEIDWWSWAELTKHDRARFQSMKIPVIEVEGSLADIVDLFVRINSTGRKLAAQERRHARFHTNPVLIRAELIAEKHKLGLIKRKVVSPAGVARMKHVELITELLLSIEAGAPINKKQRLDEIIAGGGLTPDALKRAEQGLEKSLTVVDTVIPHLASTRFHQVADFYTLVLMFARMSSEGVAVNSHTSAKNALAGDLLGRFAIEVDTASNALKNMKGIPDKNVAAYLATVKEGTDSATARRQREKILRSVIEGVFDTLDEKRTFSAAQRRIIWNSSPDKTCADCHKRLTWETFAADHIAPYIKGGKTTLANAGLRCKPCNSRKGAR